MRQSRASPARSPRQSPLIECAAPDAERLDPRDPPANGPGLAARAVRASCPSILRSRPVESRSRPHAFARRARTSAASQREHAPCPPSTSRPPSSTRTASRTSVTRSRRSAPTPSPDIVGSAATRSICSSAPTITVSRSRARRTRPGARHCDQADHASAACFGDTWDTLGIGYDRFVRTTAPHHADGVRAFIDRIRRATPGRVLRDARTRAGTAWDAKRFARTRELEAGRCPIHPTLEIERVAESNWFFRLSAFQEFLSTFLRANPDFVRREHATTRSSRSSSAARGRVDHASIARLGHSVPAPRSQRTSPGDLRLVRRVAELSDGDRVS